MSKIYFKVRLSYDSESENPTIKEEELARVIWAFAHKTDVVLPSGAFRGRDIISILPDYGACLGYNRGVKLDSIDFADYRRKYGDSAELKIESIRLLLKEEKNEIVFLEKSNLLLLN